MCAANLKKNSNRCNCASKMV